jgi:hypothetical protein
MGEVKKAPKRLGYTIPPNCPSFFSCLQPDAEEQEEDTNPSKTAEPQLFPAKGVWVPESLHGRE